MINYLKLYPKTLWYIFCTCFIGLLFIGSVGLINKNEMVNYLFILLRIGLIISPILNYKIYKEDKRNNKNE